MKEDQDKNIVEERNNSTDTANHAAAYDEATDQEYTEAPEQQEEEETLQSEEEKLQAELQVQKDKYLRLYSEFENFRRRTAKEKLELTRTANEDMAGAMLPVLDDFERAIKTFNAEGAQADTTLEGILLIYNKLKSGLERKGVKVMQIEAGSDFDPEYQEAITQIPAPNDALKGKVVDVIEKGYTLGDKVIRFAKVVIGA